MRPTIASNGPTALGMTSKVHRKNLVEGKIRVRSHIDLRHSDIEPVGFRVLHKESLVPASFSRDPKRSG